MNYVKDKTNDSEGPLQSLIDSEEDASDSVDVVPDSILKVFNPQCKCCVSQFAATINNMIVQKKKPKEIAIRLAEMGEVIHPTSIANHAKRHMHDLDAIRRFMLSKEPIDVGQEIKAQIHLTKYELEGAIDVEYRKFLMRRMDKLLKLLSEHCGRMARSKGSSPNVDARRISINTVNTTSHNNEIHAGTSPIPSLQEIAEKVANVQKSLESGEIEIVGDNGEKVDGIPRKIMMEKPSP